MKENSSSCSCIQVNALMCLTVNNNVKDIKNIDMNPDGWISGYFFDRIFCLGARPDSAFDIQLMYDILTNIRPYLPGYWI